MRINPAKCVVNYFIKVNRPVKVCLFLSPKNLIYVVKINWLPLLSSENIFLFVKYRVVRTRYLKFSPVIALYM